LWIVFGMAGQVFERAERVREGIAHGARPAIIAAVAAECRWSRRDTPRRPHVDGERPNSRGTQRRDGSGPSAVRPEPA